MPVATVNISIDQYADFALTFFYTSAGTPVNLSGATARMMIRQNPGDATPFVSISTTPNAQGSIVLGGVAGSVAVAINKATTATLAPALGPLPRFDLLIDWPNGTTTDLVSGTVTINVTNTH